MSILVCLLLVLTGCASGPATDLQGTVVDGSGGAVAAAAVTLRDPATGAERQATTDASGIFVFPAVAAGRYIVVAIASGFAASAIDVDAATSGPIRLTLEPAPVSEVVTVSSALPDPRVVSTALKIAASPLDVPQAIDAVPATVLREQGARSMQDAMRNVAGVTPNLGEGRRDQFLIRGFSAQTDTLVDGMRDDALYYRDVATVERVEVLKGPASALFGRGSSGGVINRVLKKPRFDAPLGDVAVMVGGFGTKRLSFDLGRPSDNRATAFRVTGAWEDSGSFRDFAQVSRLSVAPSVSAFVTPSTTVTVQFELLHDRRLPDRGIPSVGGAPADVPIAQYYGYPADDFIGTDVLASAATVEHRFDSGWTLRNATRLAAYDTSWSNTQPIDSRQTPSGIVVKRSQYNADQNQRNMFNQSEAIGILPFGSALHTLLVGIEAGLQRRDLRRFNGTAPDVALYAPVLTRPSYSTTAASSNRFEGTVLGVYVQDLIAIGERWKVLAGVRADRFDQQLDDRLPADVDLRRIDRTWSPRVGMVFQPTPHLSLYSNVSRSFQPSGEGLSLAANAAELGPESTRNLEGGAKLSLARGRANATASLFRVDRTNIKTTDPIDPTRLVLVGRQRTDGMELSFDGSPVARWTVRASYAGLNPRILRSNSVSSGVRIEGNRAGLVARHSASVWSTLRATEALTVGAGVTASGDRFTSNDDLVRLPGFTRLDAMASYRVGKADVAVNVQNLLGVRYYESASGNFQIYPGAPLNALVTVGYRFR